MRDMQGLECVCALYKDKRTMGPSLCAIIMWASLSVQHQGYKRRQVTHKLSWPGRKKPRRKSQQNATQSEM